jgi:hypothetical protein
MGNWVTVTVSVTLTHNGPSGRTPKRRSNGRIHDAAPDLRPTDELQTISITHIGHSLTAYDDGRVGPIDEPTTSAGTVTGIGRPRRGRLRAFVLRAREREGVVP